MLWNSAKLQAQRIIDYELETDPSFLFSPEIATAIHELWEDPIVRKILEHQNEFYLMDNAT
jgi:guanine nucleotide-binding protein G(i) subunit alpha